MKKLILLIFVVAASLNAQAVQGQIGQVPVVAAADNSPVGGAGNLTTVGSVPYVSASGILNQDAGQFVWDATNNRLGIGTATPLAPLQTSLVSTSTINEIGAIIERTGGPTSGLARGVGIVFKDASNATLVGGVAGIREGPGNDWAGGLGFFTNAAASAFSTTFANLNERMRISGNGNVGIGTITPAQTLHVKSASNEIFSDATTGDATLSTGLAGVRKWSMYNQSAGNNLLIYDWTNSVSRVTVQPGIATAMTILASGNVGIGTATPVSAIEVQSAALTTSFTNNPIIASIASTTAYAAGMGAGIQFSGKWNAPNAPTTFAYIGGVKENATDGNYDGKLVFGTRQNGTGSNDMTRMTILSSGNVGIGTTTPAATLTVVNTGATAQVRFGITAQTDFGELYRSDSLGLFVSSSVASAGAKPITFATGADVGDRMVTISGNGNVLIGGTTDGNYRLDVQKNGSSGTARFYDQTATTGTTGVVITRGAAQTGASTLLVVNGVVAFTGDNNGGAGTALLGSNSPAVTNTAPYTWIKIRTADNSVAYIPAWK